MTDGMVEVIPVDSFDLLAVIDDKEAGLEGNCPFVFLTILGALPNEPFSLEGQILADVYGIVGLGGG